VGVRLSEEEFDAMVERAVARIPGKYRERMTNLTIQVEREGPSADLLGLYEGRPATERSLMDMVEWPDRIRIFQRAHERMARSVTDLERIVNDTVWHEVGHYFGLDEREVRAVEERRERLRRLRRPGEVAKRRRGR
jgi:predicted Zn-dependent protease with MMP-like domain